VLFQLESNLDVRASRLLASDRLNQNVNKDSRVADNDFCFDFCADLLGCGGGNL